MSYVLFGFLFSLATSNPVTPKPPLFNTLLYSLVPIMGIAVIVLFSFWMYRHHKLAYPPVLVPTQVSCCIHFSFLKGKVKTTNMSEAKRRTKWASVAWLRSPAALLIWRCQCLVSAKANNSASTFIALCILIDIWCMSEDLFKKLFWGCVELNSTEVPA